MSRTGGAASQADAVIVDGTNGNESIRLPTGKDRGHSEFYNL